MKNKKVIVLFIILSCFVFFNCASLFIRADEGEKIEKESFTYIKKIDEKKQNLPSSEYMTIKEIEKVFVENSKSIKLEKLKQDLKQETLISDEEKLEKLEKNIKDVEKSKSDLEEKLDEINRNLDISHLLPSETVESLEEKKEKAIDGIEKYDENLEEMRKNYILLDYKMSSNSVDLSNRENSLEDFIESEINNLEKKILDIVELDKLIIMKNDEYKFIKNLYDMNKITYKLGFIDKMTLIELQNSLDEIDIDIESMNTSFNDKFDEIAFIIGVDDLNGIKLEKNYFDYELKSYVYSYYVKKCLSENQNIALMNEKIDLIGDTEIELRDDYENDADILEVNKKQAEINKKSIRDSLEIASKKMLSAYKKLEKEKSKLILKQDLLLKKKSANDLTYSLGYMSKLDCDKLEFEFEQVEKSINLLEIKMLRIKKALDSLASGIIQK